MQKHHAAIGSYHFKRAKTDGVIQVLNEGSYLMAEYAEKTGSISWQRVVLASQREAIEKWLREHYPKPGAAAPLKETMKATMVKTVMAKTAISKTPAPKSALSKNALPKPAMAKTASARA